MGSITIEFWQFLRHRKKSWLAPIPLVLLLMSLLIIFTEGSVIAPFVYTLLEVLPQRGLVRLLG